MNLRFFSALLFALVFACIFASGASEPLKKGHMKLLAVSESSDGTFRGITADLYLEVGPGEGKVFIESFPLTKMDTQISTRFAKEIACNEFNLDCDNYNFYYTIKADTTLVGGPSASAAASVLTAAVMQNIPIDERIAMSGTINSGGVIGPVGGLKDKISAAPKMGLRKILIPKGEAKSRESNISNATVNLIDLGKNIGIEVVEVSDIREALSQFTGRDFTEHDQGIVIDPSYTDTMKDLAEMLCSKALESSKMSVDDENVTSTAKNFSDKGAAALALKKYYSSASYCFGADVRYKFLYYKRQNLTKEQISEQVELIKQKAMDLESSAPERKTITDLQTYATVKERLLDSYDNLNYSAVYLAQNRTDDALFALAYADERVFSAQAWSRFFGKGGATFKFDKQTLENSCTQKISEAEERYEYSKIYFPEGLSSAKVDISRAYEDLDGSNYELCLAKASKAKAEADLLLSSLGVEESSLKDLLEKKLSIAKRSIVKSANKGVFPIVGYSYYEYAESLQQNDPYSALLYTEYALELGNLDMYFKEKNTSISLPKLPGSVFIAFVVGAIVGAGAALVVFSVKPRKRVVKKASVRRR